MLEMHKIYKYNQPFEDSTSIKDYNAQHPHDDLPSDPVTLLRQQRYVQQLKKHQKAKASFRKKLSQTEDA